MRAALNILAAVVLVGGALPAFAAPFWQKKDTPPATQRQSAPAPAAQSNSLLGQSQGRGTSSFPGGHLNGPGPHNGDWLRKYGDLPPAQQEQKLQSDPVFRSLTPEKQKSLIKRLEQFNSLTPSKKRQVLSRMETYEHLSPAQQRQADSLFKSYRGLPPEQQSQVSQAYKELRSMNAEQRAQYFNSDEFLNGMDEQQRSLLRGMSELYPSPNK